METDLQLINTYNDIIITPIILSKVIEELQIDATPEQLSIKLHYQMEVNRKFYMRYKFKS